MVAFVSFRFSAHDGVSVETAKWARAFASLGFRTVTVAGEGIADRLVPGLAIASPTPPDKDELESALADADIVVVENLCSLPLNPVAATMLAAALANRPAILHHHDLAWQRSGPPEPTQPFPPDDPAWAHVTINHLSRRQLGDRGIDATTIANCFDTSVAPGRRGHARRCLGLSDGELLLLHPTRAIPRKNVAAAMDLAAGLGAAYWLLGPAEDGYGPELDRLASHASTRVIRGIPSGLGLADAYAACDAVTLPSTWEGFGNATLEAAIHRKPLAIAAYPVAAEIAAYGFRWFPADDAGPLSRWLAQPDGRLLDTNRAIAERHFSLACLRRRLAHLLEVRGWKP